uniref:Uncharacterized protein n=1 Tax=Ditylenchus dipsaci TaxID=166011 RepID=A0A915EN11_9BILA
MFFKSKCAFGLFALVLFCTTIIQFTSAIGGRFCDEKLKWCNREVDSLRRQSVLDQKVRADENAKMAEELATLQEELAMCRSERG